MTWIALITVLVIALGLVPLLLLASTAELRAEGRKQKSSLGSYYYGSRRFHSMQAAYSGHVFQTQDDRPAHRAGQEDVRRSIFERSRESHAAQTVVDASFYEYTIRRATGDMRSHVEDNGGFAEVMLRLYDRVGNSYSVPRRLSTN